MKYCLLLSTIFVATIIVVRIVLISITMFSILYLSIDNILYFAEKITTYDSGVYIFKRSMVLVGMLIVTLGSMLVLTALIVLLLLLLSNGN